MSHAITCLRVQTNTDTNNLCILQSKQKHAVEDVEVCMTNLFVIHHFDNYRNISKCTQTHTCSKNKMNISQLHVKI